MFLVIPGRTSISLSLPSPVPPDQARPEGMITDPVYEGKSMQGMIDLVGKGFIPKR